MILEYKIIDNKYENIKAICKSYFHISERLLIKLKKEKKILLNGKSVFINFVPSINDILTIDLDFDEYSPNIVPTKMDLDILFEDESMLIINKPANLPVHPSMGHFEDSLANGVKYYFVEKEYKSQVIRPVIRLDKDTSGIVVFAKNEYIQESLISQMKQNTFKKEYIAILTGILNEKQGTINAPIARKENSIIEREINPNGDISITHYKVLKKLNIKNEDNNINLSLVNFLLETGRTHQIRIHSKYINHPILGDSLYGEKSNLISRQALHAYKIFFTHPITKKGIEIIASIPQDILNVIK